MTKLEKIQELLERYPNKDCFFKQGSFALSYPIVGEELCVATTKMSKEKFRELFTSSSGIYLGIIEVPFTNDSLSVHSYTISGKAITWFPL